MKVNRSEFKFLNLKRLPYVPIANLAKLWQEIERYEQCSGYGFASLWEPDPDPQWSEKSGAVDGGSQCDNGTVKCLQDTSCGFASLRSKLSDLYTDPYPTQSEKPNPDQQQHDADPQHWLWHKKNTRIYEEKSGCETMVDTGSIYIGKRQCFGSRSVLDHDSIRSVDSESRSGSRRTKMTKFHVLKCWMFSLRTEGFSCSLDVLYRGLGISKLQFLIKKYHFFQFLVIKTLDPNLNPDRYSA